MSTGRSVCDETSDSTGESVLIVAIIDRTLPCQSTKEFGDTFHPLIGSTTKIASGSRKKMTRIFSDIVMIFEKRTEQLEWRKLLPQFDRNRRIVSIWTARAWLNHLERGSNKSRFQYCLDSDGNILYLRTSQGHSGGNRVDLSLQDNVRIPYACVEYIYHVASSLVYNSITQAGLLGRWKIGKKDERRSFSQQWVP